MRTALVIFRLARHFDRNPMIVGYLIAIAVRGYGNRSANEALQTGPVSKEVRDALDAELAIQERMEGFVWAMKSERAMCEFRHEMPDSPHRRPVATSGSSAGYLEFARVGVPGCVPPLDRDGSHSKPLP